MNLITGLANLIARSFVGCIGMALLLTGLVFGGFGVMSGVGTTAFLSQAETADGTVVRIVRVTYKEDDDNDHDYTYRPIVRFTTANGEPTEFEGSVGGDPPHY